MKTLEELFTLDTYNERLIYLLLEGSVSDRTFGGLRELNQRFYKSSEWANVRAEVITRDSGCDMALVGYEIVGTPYVHHINPVKPDDLLYNPSKVLDPKGLITVSHETHQKIHYGVKKDLETSSRLIDRYPNDTIPWRCS